jgi:hypothetical protein
VSVANAPSGAPSTSLNIISSKHLFVPSLAVNSTALFIPDLELSDFYVIGTANFYPDVQYEVTPAATALDSSSLYWTGQLDGGNFAIYKATIDIGSDGMVGPLLLERPPGNALTLALYSNYVYFADDQLIRKTPK